MKRWKYLSMLLVLALTAAACGDGAEPPADEPPETTTTTEARTTTTTEAAEEPAEEPTAEAEAVRIGSIHPLTGPLAAAGTKMENAIQMAVEEINEAGGIESLGGAPLEVLTADTTGAPEVGQAEAERLINEGAVTLIGPFQSAVAANVATIAEREEVPFLIDVAVADEILEQGFTYVFRIQPNATAMGRFGAEYLAAIAELRGEPITRVSYLHEDSGFGTSVADAFTARAEELGIEVVERIPYGAFTVTELTTEMTQAAAADPDVVIVTGYYNDGLLAARAAVDLDLDVMGVYGVAQGTYDTPEFTQDFGALAEFFFDSNYHFNAADPRVAEVRANFEELYGEQMDTAAMLSYQAVYVLADALERAASTDPTAIRDALAETRYEDHLLAYPGPIEFDDRGENINAQPVLMQVIDGEVRQVWPPELQEAEPVFPAVSWKQN